MKQRVAVLLALALSAGGCAFAEHGRYQAADEAYRACLDEHPRDTEECEPLRADRDAAYRKYERTAERAWGCDRTPQGCEARPGTR